jgi:hypothetical protein
MMAKLQDDMDIYTLQQFLELSPAGKPYQWFCKHLLPCVVGAKVWHKKQTKELIGSVALCSDEAFALLTLENNYDCWMAVARWHVNNDDEGPEDHQSTFQFRCIQTVG